MGPARQAWLARRGAGGVARGPAERASVEYAARENDPQNKLTGRQPAMATAAPTKPQEHVETFPNPNPARDYTIRITIPEFTCLCPKTGQPDFAQLELEYVPAERCVELKALKLYMWSFRDRGAFHEAITNEILERLANATDPRFMRLTGKFNVRGGLYTTVIVEYRKPGWAPPTPVTLP